LTFHEDKRYFEKVERPEKINILLEVSMFVFGPVGPMELLLIVLIVVIIFGARRLPELGKSLGQGIKNFKKSVSNPEEEEKSGSEKNDSEK
jgi:sec-independent protein translocase protein TatA